jgi:hypothetical protein
LASNSGWVRLLTNKSRKVFKKDLKQKHPFSKEFLAEVTQRNPRLLEFYKELRGAKGALENEDLEKSYSETDFAGTLADKLRAIKSGSKHATEYHTAIAGILTFLFYPELVYPVLEEGLHGGRKRIDLTFTNWSNSGFFAAVKLAPQTRARYIIVECKNYGEDLANPEFDQLTGRFSPARGRLGIICCRKNANKKAILERSKDAVRDDRGFVIVLDDDDILAMLDAAGSGKRKNIFLFLERRYREIVF